MTESTQVIIDLGNGNLMDASEFGCFIAHSQLIKLKGGTYLSTTLTPEELTKALQIAATFVRMQEGK